MDASDAAVKTGQTCPASLSVMLKRGVQIFSRDGLHAKVFVFGNAAFIGSANVSGNSERYLIEAVAVTRQRSAVAGARQFVRAHCHKSLGPTEIKRLQKIYREPIFTTATTPQGDKKSDDRLRIVRLVDYNPPEGMSEAAEQKEKVARKKIKNSNTHTLYEFHWGYRHKFSERETILPVHKDNDGRVFVCAPGAIVSISHWKKAKTVVFLEVPIHRRIQLRDLAKRIGPAAGRMLKNGRIIRDRGVIDLLLDVFSPPFR